jgi:hypothetical protein
MATFVYGRKQRSSGGSVPKKHKRGHFSTDPLHSRYDIKLGLVGEKVTIEDALYTAKTYSNKKLRLRRLPCGHGVFMVRGQFPDAETFCIQCRDGQAVR